MSDNAAVRRYLALIYKYKDDIYRIIYSVVEDREIALDLRQNVLLNAWKSFDTLREPDKSRAWVMAITRNVIRKYMKDKKVYLSVTDREFLNDIEEIDTLQVIERDILDALVEKEDVKNVFDALNSLDLKYRMVIKEHLIAGTEFKEIAENNGLNPGSVRVLYSRGMKKLREAYAKLEKGGALNG